MKMKHLGLLFVLLQLHRVAEEAVLQVLDFGFHPVQQPLQFPDLLRLLSRLVHVLLGLLS